MDDPYWVYICAVSSLTSLHWLFFTNSKAWWHNNKISLWNKHIKPTIFHENDATTLWKMATNHTIEWWCTIVHKMSFYLMSENQHHRNGSGAGNQSALVRNWLTFPPLFLLKKKAWEFPNAQHSNTNHEGFGSLKYLWTYFTSQCQIPQCLYIAQINGSEWQKCDFNAFSSLFWVCSSSFVSISISSVV